MKRVKIVLKEDLTEKFKKFWGTEPFMVKGWETWEYKDNVEDHLSGTDINFHPENNAYGINFPSILFEIKNEIQ